MERLAGALRKEGYEVVNVGYPSTRHPIQTLVDEHVVPRVEEVRQRHDRVHFVTHSLGGILVRALAAREPLPETSRAVLLAPPNAGSPVADLVCDLLPFRWWCGPALQELGTGEGSVPLRLPAATFEVGVIAGERAVFPWFNAALGGPNDGIVSCEATGLEGAADTIRLSVGHTFIMLHREAIRQTLHFLQHGRFDHAPT